jgi:hypothetical protein
MNLIFIFLKDIKILKVSNNKKKDGKVNSKTSSKK